MDFYLSLVVKRSRENLAAARRDGGVALDLWRGYAAKSFYRERERGHVEQ